LNPSCDVHEWKRDQRGSFSSRHTLHSSFQNNSAEELSNKHEAPSLTLAEIDHGRSKAAAESLDAYGLRALLPYYQYARTTTETQLCAATTSRLNHRTPALLSRTCPSRDFSLPPGNGGTDESASTKKDRIVWICNYPFSCPFPPMEFGLWHYLEKSLVLPAEKPIKKHGWQSTGPLRPGDVRFWTSPKAGQKSKSTTQRSSGPCFNLNSRVRIKAGLARFRGEKVS
jgi:hypothetical protein